jgi:hypothetical protein
MIIFRHDPSKLWIFLQVNERPNYLLVSQLGKMSDALFIHCLVFILTPCVAPQSTPADLHDLEGPYELLLLVMLRSEVIGKILLVSPHLVTHA